MIAEATSLLAQLDEDMKAAAAGMDANGANYTAYRNYQAAWADARDARAELLTAIASPEELAAEAERQHNEIGYAATLN